MQRYKEIKCEILKIISEDNVSGKLPPIRELMKMFSTSQITIDKAIFELKKDGYLSPEIGRGTYIKRKVASDNIRPDYKTIGFIISDSKVLYEEIVISASLDLLNSEGYSVSIFPTNISTVNKYDTINKYAYNKSIHGWIIMPSHYTLYDPDFHNMINQHINKNAPFISIDFSAMSNPTQMVGVNDFLAGKQIAERLFDLNIDDVGFVWTPESPACQQRLNGLKSAFNNNSHSCDIQFITCDKFFNLKQEEIFSSYRSGVKTFIIASPQLVNLYVKTYYDGLIKGIFKNSDDIKTIAFIEPDQRSYLPESFIKVVKPSYEMGYYAAKSLLELIKGNNPDIPKYFECSLEDKTLEIGL